MLPGDTGVAVVKVSPMCPAVVVVGIFWRQLGCGCFAIAATTAVAVGLPGLLVDCLLDDRDELGQNRAASCLQ